MNIHLPLKMKELSEEQRAVIVEEFSKALAVAPPLVKGIRKDEHNIWVRNDDELLGNAEEDLYEALVYPAMDSMASLIAALGLSDELVQIEKSLSPDYLAYEYDILKGRNARSKLSDLMELSKKKRQGFLKYLEGASNWTRKKLKEIDAILNQKLPDPDKLAEEYAVRAAFIAKVRDTADTEALQMTGAFVDRFPATIEAAKREGVALTAAKAPIPNLDFTVTEDELNVALAEARAARQAKVMNNHKILPLQPQEIKTVENAQLRTAEKISEVADRHKAAIKQVVLQAINGRWSSQKLAQALFDQFGDQNRDWRRVAITELAMASSDAYLAGCKDGDQVWVPPVEGSCKWCKLYLEGKTFTVTTDPNLMGHTYQQEMQYVWVGKTNYGRTTSTWIPCIPLHPNCRHRYHKISRFYKVGEDGKPVMKATKELIQEERARRGLPPDPNLP